MNKYTSCKRNGKRIDEHRLIMEQFLGRKLNKKEVVHHKDGNKSNNNINNLEVMSLSDHSRMHQLGTHHSENTLVKMKISTKNLWTNGVFDTIKQKISAYDSKTGEFVKIFNSTRDAESFGFNRRHIFSCCSGKRKQHHGYIWKYANDDFIKILQNSNDNNKRINLNEM